MSDVIAEQLAGLYKELANRVPFSDVVRVDLTEAGAHGCVARLLICECDSADLQLVSTFRRFWIVDAEGFHTDAKWPLTNKLVQQEGWENSLPFVKFATDGRNVRIGMRFGSRWYVSCDAPLGPDGRFLPEQMVHGFRSTK